MKSFLHNPSEKELSQDAALLDEKPTWAAPKLVRLDIDETEGAVAGNADPFVS